MADEIPPLLARNPDEPLYSPLAPDDYPGETYVPTGGEVPLPGVQEQSLDPEFIEGPGYPSLRLPTGPPPPSHWVYDPKTGKSVPVADPRGREILEELAVPPGQRPPPSAVTEAGLLPYAQQVPRALDMRAMFAGMAPPGIDLSGARQAVSQLKGYEGRIEKAGKETEDLLGEKAAILERQSGAEQRLISQQEKIREAALRQQNEADRLRTQAREAANADIRQKLNGLQDLQNNLAAAKIDPDRFWKEKDTGQRIAIAIGVALGTMGSILLKGGPNYALNIIEKAIDRDLDAQKADLQRLGMQANLQQNLIAQTRAITEDEESSYKAAKSMLLDKVASDYELAGLRYKDETTKSRLGLLVNDVSVLSQKFRGETAMRLADSAARRYNAEFQMAGAESAAANQKWMASMKLLQSKGSGLNPGLKVHGAGPLKTIYAQKANEAYENIDNLTKQYDKLIELAKMPNWKKYMPQIKGAAGAIASVMTSKAGKEFGLGKLSEADFALLKKVVADPTEITIGNIFTDQTLARLKTARQATIETGRATLRGFGADFEREPVGAPPEEED